MRIKLWQLKEDYWQGPTRVKKVWFGWKGGNWSFVLISPLFECVSLKSIFTGINKSSANTGL